MPKLLEIRCCRECKHFGHMQTECRKNPYEPRQILGWGGDGIPDFCTLPDAIDIVVVLKRVWGKTQNKEAKDG